MDDDSLRHIAEIEASGTITGIGRIQRGECPVDCRTTIACMLCPYGHMLECHHPYTCEEAECGHWQSEREMEFEW